MPNIVCALVAMSQKSSFTQPSCFVSQALTSNSLFESDRFTLCRRACALESCVVADLCIKHPEGRTRGESYTREAKGNVYHCRHNDVEHLETAVAGYWLKKSLTTSIGKTLSEAFGERSYSGICIGGRNACATDLD
jgi:hypothetical protein